MPRRLPTRSCVACRTTRPKRDLVRVVRGPLGGVTIDATGRAPGRGAYLCNDAGCWSSAARRKAIEHALGVSLPADVAAAIAAGPPAAESTTNPTAGARTAQPSPAPETESDQGGARGQE